MDEDDKALASIAESLKRIADWLDANATPPPGTKGVSYPTLYRLLRDKL